MVIRVLGSAAGGGLPQWNCYCDVCRSARRGETAPQTQSSIAVRAKGGGWFLGNASPDLRQQIATLPAQETDGQLRRTPVAGIVLTDAEIDHTAGLLLMRESNEPLRIWSTAEVRDALTRHYPVLPMLERYCGVTWSELALDTRVDLDDALEIEVFPTGGDKPLYADGSGDFGSVGLTVRDRVRGTQLTYAPSLAELRPDILERFRASDCVLVDGTFWRNDELVSLGLSRRDAYAMGHAPLAPPDGSLAALASLPSRTVLIHINNTNPVVLDGSPERASLVASGIDVAHDGMEIEL
jgi:pyrroloquinoline quinone biosynthesis protein B